jgi:hypothetical protein
LSRREKLPGPDVASGDLLEVVLADLGIERGLVIVVLQFRHRHLLVLRTNYYSILQYANPRSG